MKNITITYHKEAKHQTIESFGMSTAWWGKLVGSWDDVNRSVMQQFYDPINGIGLTNIRYNIGAGSMEAEYVKDASRRTESFEVSPGAYDFTRDKNTIKLLDYAMEYGCEEIVFFAISPLARMTRSNMVCGNNDPNLPSNHLPEYYESYCTYILDVVEHFLSLGYPIKYVSPINEPQWEWGMKSQSQEGCYYEIEEVVALYKVFVKELNKRQLPVQLAGHDGGEWMTANKYAQAIFAEPELDKHMTQLDSHSYWTNATQKQTFKLEFDQQYSSKKLVMSEWCEMKGGGLDYGMNSAFVLAQTMHEDLTILDVVSWQYWTGCEKEKYQHKVALMYIKEEVKQVLPTKKLYAMGQYSKFVRPGSIRIEETIDGDSLPCSSYTYNDTIVSVLINESEEAYHIVLPGYAVLEMIITDEHRDLQSIPFTGVIPPRSISTIRLKEE